MLRTWKQPGYPSTDEGIQKLWYMYTIEYYSAIKKECICVSPNEVGEPRACYTRWSKSEKDKCCISMHTYGIRKMVLMNLLAGQQLRHRHREETCGHSGGRGGGADWESSVETYTLPYVKQMASGNLLCDTGSSTQCSGQSRGVGWGGKWEGGSGGRGHMYTCGWFMLMCGRNQHNIIKQLSSN